MRTATRALMISLLAFGCALFVSNATGAGRRMWYPYWAVMAETRTHETVVGELGSRLRPGLEATFREAHLPYPPRELVLVGLKQERRLEVWAPHGTGFHRVRDYAVLAASGGPGPKRREGDLQVPEGIYRLTAFNPRSSYHLSIRVDYPNADDHAGARAEGRTNLGGDIYIHGKSVSIGCLAIGDDAIEELYLLLADAGLRRTTLLLASEAGAAVEPSAPDWLRAVQARLAERLTAVRGPARPDSR